MEAATWTVGPQGDGSRWPLAGSNLWPWPSPSSQSLVLARGLQPTLLRLTKAQVSQSGPPVVEGATHAEGPQMIKEEGLEQGASGTSHSLPASSWELRDTWLAGTSSGL